jgi:hypothetical protein
MTSTGLRTLFRKSAAGKRYVENSDRAAMTGDERTSVRTSGNADSRITPSGGRVLAA